MLRLSESCVQSAMGQRERVESFRGWWLLRNARRQRFAAITLLLVE